MEFDTEKQLWLDFTRGDADAYASLYRLYAQQMYLYGLHLADSAEKVEDAIHDLFVKLYNNRSRLPEKIDNLRLYLFISLKNILLNRSGRFGEAFRMDITGVSSLACDDDNAENRLIATEMSAQRKQLLERLECILSPRQQQAIYYRFIEQMPYKDVAMMMGINVQSAKNTVQAAIEKMRQELPADVCMLLISCLLVEAC